jgi:plastocyanin
MKNNLRAKKFRVACAGLALTFCLSPVAVLAGEIHALVRDKKGKGIVDAVVVALPAKKTAGNVAGSTATIIIDQVNKEFVPYVLPVRVGTAVNFPNLDNIRHHVYSFSPAKTFELPLYTGTPAAPVLFDKSGVVVLGCNIHDWMIAYIYVSESPYFAKTGTDGKATLADLPAGDYTVRTWHPRLQGKEDATERKISIPQTGAVASAWEIGLTPDFRIRRAPIPGQSGY